MTRIVAIDAREILDSRGNPTVETTVTLNDGTEGTASVPSGASVGIHEAVELRDDDHTRFNGKGVLKVVANVKNVLAPKLIGLNPIEQHRIDTAMIELDGTKNKGKLGANSILSISLATAVAAANSEHKPLYKYLYVLAKQYGLLKPTLGKLPTPCFNIINGGKHGAGTLDIQEFLIVPAKTKSFSESLRIGVEVYHSLKEILIHKKAIHSVGDEGGFAPNFPTNTDACKVITEAIQSASYSMGSDVFLGLDVAPAHFIHSRKYRIKDKQNPLTRDEFLNYLVELNNRYHLIYLEDPLQEDDWEGWKLITGRFPRTTVIIGDDLLVTNPQRLQKAIDTKACTGILIKLNQIGTLTETLEVIKMAKNAGLYTIISHRSGETNNAFIADFSVAVDSDYVKFGAPARGERVAKYNRLLSIESEFSNT